MTKGRIRCEEFPKGGNPRQGQVIIILQLGEDCGGGACLCVCEEGGLWGGGGGGGELTSVQQEIERRRVGGARL